MESGDFCMGIILIPALILFYWTIKFFIDLADVLMYETERRKRQAEQEKRDKELQRMYYAPKIDKKSNE